MNALNRSCTLSVSSGSHVISLNITFPQTYPHDAIPAFEFTADTSFDLATRPKLIKVLNENLANSKKGCFNLVSLFAFRFFKRQRSPMFDTTRHVWSPVFAS